MIHNVMQQEMCDTAGEVMSFPKLYLQWVALSSGHDASVAYFESGIDEWWCTLHILIITKKLDALLRCILLCVPPNSVFIWIAYFWHNPIMIGLGSIWGWGPAVCILFSCTLQFFTMCVLDNMTVFGLVNSVKLWVEMSPAIITPERGGWNPGGHPFWNPSSSSRVIPPFVVPSQLSWFG
jgi:hypothetical protein